MIVGESWNIFLQNTVLVQAIKHLLHHARKFRGGGTRPPCHPLPMPMVPCQFRACVLYFFVAYLINKLKSILSCWKLALVFGIP